MTPTHAPTHVPFVVSIMCSSIGCDHMPTVQDLVRGNLGPLLSDGDRVGHIACARMHTGVVDCDVYAPWRTSCTCCKQLKETFTPEVLSDVLATRVDAVEINCELPIRYRKCKID